MATQEFLIDVAMQDDVAIVHPTGRIAIGVGDVVLREKITGLLQRGIRKLILVLADVNSIDSSGLGELVGIYTTVTSNDGRIVLVNPSPGVKKALGITGLIAGFEVFESIAQALQDLKT